jgi:DNA-cytosine methyltransferase
MTIRNTISLFDGMSCFQIALKELGITPIKYYASEIDKHAIKLTQHNFPNTVQMGDVTKWMDWDIDWSTIDIIAAGSPCQGFSFAGKQLAFDDPRSKLFFVFIDVLNHVKQFNPNVLFLLENVIMAKRHEVVINEYTGLRPVKINSALVSAQSRKRNYWSNIRTRKEGLFDEIFTDIPQPKDRGILLKDILESDVAEKYYLSENMLKYFNNRAANFNQGKVNIREEDGKASALTSSMASCDISDNFIVAINANNSQSQDKSSALLSRYHKGAANFGSDTFIAASRGRNPENPKSRKSGLETEQQLEPRYDGKTNTITSVQKDNLVMQLNGSTESGGKQPFQQNRIYSTDGIAPALCEGKADLLIRDIYTNEYGVTSILEPGYRIRRLTTKECSKLQTIPDWYNMTVISQTQQYRVLGNGWTIEAIKHILSYINL